MFGFLSRYRSAILAGGLALLALGFLSAGGRRDDFLGRSVGLLGVPVQILVDGVANGLGSAVDRYVLLAGADREAERLRREVADLRRELLAVEEVGLENQRLKALLAFKQSTTLELLPARVVGQSALPWFRTLVLDKGARDGIAYDAPVLTPGGVVGRVYEVAPGASRVLLITDANSAVDAIVQRTRAQVVVEGRAGAECNVLYLARGEEAQAGDRVVTSGLDGIFPKGLLIGELVQVAAPPGEVFQSASLRPSADFARIEEVFVVQRQPSGEEP